MFHIIQMLTYNFKNSQIRFDRWFESKQRSNCRKVIDCLFEKYTVNSSKLGTIYITEMYLKTKY